MRKPTVARGAVIARSLVQRYIARQIRKVSVMRASRAGTSAVHLRGYIAGLQDLRVWLIDQPTRTKRKGGIGR